MALPKVALFQTANNVKENIQISDESEHKSGLLRTLSPIIIAGQVLGLICSIILLIITAQPLLLGAAVLYGLGLLAVLIGQRWLENSRYLTAIWLLVGISLITQVYGYLLFGTGIMVPLAFLALITLAIIFIPGRQILMITGFWIIFNTGLFLFQDIWKIYAPPVSLSRETQTIVNLLLVAFLILTIVAFLLILGRSQTLLLQTQNLRLESLVVEHDLARAMLKESEQRLRATFEQAAVGIVQIGLDGRFRLVNQKFCEITGYSSADMPELNLEKLIYPEDLPKTKENLQHLLLGEIESFNLEKRYICKDGALLWVDANTSLVREVKGEPKYFISIIQDISKRKQAEEQINFQASLLDHVHNAVIAADARGQIIYWNKFAEALYQWKAEEVAGKVGAKLIPANPDEDLVQNAINDVENEGHWEGEFLAMRKDGSILLVYVSINSIKDADGRIKGYISVSVDTTERKQTEEALADETERLAVTLRSIGDGVITTDTNGCIVLINSVAERLTGWTQEEAFGQPLPEIFQIINSKTREIAPNPVKNVLKTGSIVGLASHTALIARDGTERFISNSAAPIDRNGQTIGVVLVFRDITERMRMEEEMQKNQKLESLGILAGGIAHDFNNILTAIVGNIFMAKMETRTDDGIYELLTEAETATFRAKDLTQQLLTFSRGGAPIKKTASLKELLKESVGFALRGSKVRSKFYIPDDLWPVEIDAGQINQVINNLVINADQAMAQGGQLTVSAENVLYGSYNPALPLKKGDYVRVTFRDEGIGIPPQNLPKIFDPYFTTKQKGSGLGLATSFSIVNRHEGYIGVESEMGVGTTFEIYLPASPHKKVVEDKTTEGPQRGHGRVLLMDDDKMIRDLGARALKQLGYEVDVAHDGNEALELYQEALVKRSRYDVVIMDLTVPGGMGGKEAISNLLKIDPEVKAIVSSGYSNDPVMANYESYHFRGVLTKPFMIDELSHKIEKLIND